MQLFECTVQTLHPKAQRFIIRLCEFNVIPAVLNHCNTAINRVFHSI